MLPKQHRDVVFLKKIAVRSRMTPISVFHGKTNKQLKKPSPPCCLFRSTQGSNLEPPDYRVVVRRSAIEPADLLCLLKTGRERRVKFKARPLGCGSCGCWLLRGTEELERPPRGGPGEWVSNSETAASHAGQRRAQSREERSSLGQWQVLELCRLAQAFWSLKLSVLKRRFVS